MTYTFKTVNAPDATNGTKLGGVNNDGVVSGWSVGSGSAFIDTNDKFTPITGLDQKPNTTARGIDAAGDVVGKNGPPGYVWSAADGSVQHIPDTVAQGTSFQAFDINDNGQVVGTVKDTAQSGFVWNQGDISLIKAPGATVTEAHGINNQGVIVGSADKSGFIDVNRKFYKVDIDGAKVTNPMDINNFNHIAGSYQDNVGNWHGFIDIGGKLQFINAPGANASPGTNDIPGAADTWVTGINDKDTVVGFFDTVHGGPTQGFVATLAPDTSMPNMMNMTMMGMSDLKPAMPPMSNTMPPGAYGGNTMAPVSPIDAQPPLVVGQV